MAWNDDDLDSVEDELTFDKDDDDEEASDESSPWYSYEDEDDDPTDVNPLSEDED